MTRPPWSYSFPYQPMPWKMTVNRLSDYLRSLHGRAVNEWMNARPSFYDAIKTKPKEK